MSGEKIGNQTIGCSVSHCRYNGGEYCELSRIEVRPCSDCGAHAQRGHESLCGNYCER